MIETTSCGYYGRKGKHKFPESYPAWEEDVESAKRRTTLQRFANKKEQVSCTSESIQKCETTMSQHTLSKTKLATLKQKKKRWVALILMKKKKL